MEKLHCKKINEFIENLNEREKIYIYKKLKNDFLSMQVLQVDFTINGEKIVNS